MPTENTELVLVTNPELVKIVKDKGLEPVEEKTIQTSYQPYFDQMAEIKELAKKIDFENPTEIDEKIARELRLRTVKIRTGSQDVKDERKRIHTLKANIEQDAWNLIKSTCQLEEEQFLQVEKKREKAEQLRKENIRGERTAELSEYTERPSIYPLGEMEEKDYQELKEGLKLQKQAKAEAERKSAIYHERKEVISTFGLLYDSESLEGFIPLTAEMTDTEYVNLLSVLESAKQKRIAEQAETKRLDELQRKREIEIAPFIQFFTQESDLRLMPEFEYEMLIVSLHTAKADYDLEQENIRKENERQKKLLEEKEAQLKAEREASEKKQREIEEKARLEREESERKAKAEKEKQDAILAEQQKQNDLKIQAEREAKEKLEKEIQAQKDEEIRKENERILAEKKALLAPDKEKLVLLSKAFQSVQLPELKTSEASEILEKIEVLKQKIVTYILEQSDKL